MTKGTLAMVISVIAFFALALCIILEAIPYQGPFVHAAPSLSVHGVGSIAVIFWQQPPEADTAIVLRQRQPQLVEALRLIAGPQSVEDDNTAPGDVYWIDFWNGSDPVGATGPVSVQWEMRIIFP